MFSNFNILLAVTCFFGIVTMNPATTTNKVAECKNDILKLNGYASLALRNAKQIYCENVPRLNTSCDLFIAILTNESTIRFPQLIFPQKINVENEQNVLFNISATIDEYLKWVRWGLKKECKMLYEPVTDFECVFANICKDHKNGDKAIFYCQLYVLYQFLEHFNNYLKSTITSNSAPTMVEHQSLPPDLKDGLYIRWHLMKILDAGIKQTIVFEKVMKP